LTLAVIPRAPVESFGRRSGWVRDAGKDLDVGVMENPLAETELAEQNKIIENMLNLGVDGMAIALNCVMRKGNVVAGFQSSSLIRQSMATENYVATDNTLAGLATVFVEQLADSKSGSSLRYIRHGKRESSRALDTARRPVLMCSPTLLG
jgi:ABC-type sugar transport system substrate-binding protein